MFTIQLFLPFFFQWNSKCQFKSVVTKTWPLSLKVKFISWFTPFKKSNFQTHSSKDILNSWININNKHIQPKKWSKSSISHPINPEPSTLNPKPIQPKNLHFFLKCTLLCQKKTNFLAHSFHGISGIYIQKSNKHIPLKK